ncbi:MAG: TIGR01906 family membrane protein [Aerococcus sp.]|nr:TIGR01906 family membrane protein [Aerococcus sp.]
MMAVIKSLAQALILGVWSLLLGFVIVACLSPLIWLLTLTLSGDMASLPWSFATMFRNYMAMLGYLLFPWITVLQMPDFPSSYSALSHFAEVKQLFMLAFIVFVIFTFIVYLVVRKWRHSYVSVVTQYLLDGLMILPVALIVLASLNFNQWFIAFHYLFFNNNDWLFNPVTDPIILILPEYFFAVCAAAVVIFDIATIYGIKRLVHTHKLPVIPKSDD